jgi:translation initiation factor 1
MSPKNDWKKREGVVYSTSSDFEYQHQENSEASTLPAGKQHLKVSLDKKMRAGKQVTIITGFVGSSSDLEELTKMINTKCGVGGSSKDGEIIIQGDVRPKVVQLLEKAGYHVKLHG